MSEWHSSKKYGFTIAIVILVSSIVYFLGIRFFALFDEASDSIKATSITAIVSVLVFSFGRYFEQGREAKQRINSEKVEVYRRFFDFYFDLMT